MFFMVFAYYSNFWCLNRGICALIQSSGISSTNGNDCNIRPLLCCNIPQLQFMFRWLSSLKLFSTVASRDYLKLLYMKCTLYEIVFIFCYYLVVGTLLDAFFPKMESTKTEHKSISPT